MLYHELMSHLALLLLLRMKGMHWVKSLESLEIKKSLKGLEGFRFRLESLPTVRLPRRTQRLEEHG